MTPSIVWAYVGTDQPPGFTPLRNCHICGSPIIWIDLQRANGFDVLRLVAWGEENQIRCRPEVHLKYRNN